MIGKAAQISLSIRIQALIEKLGDHFSLDVQGTRSQIHHMIQTSVKFSRSLGLISNSRHVNGNNTNGTCTLTGTKETAALFTEFPQIQTKSAAHTSDIAGFHVTVNIIGKIWGSIFGSHFKKQSVIFCI